MLHTRDIDSLDFTMIGGVSYHKKWGTLSLEWDGSNINFGSRFLVNNSFIFRNGITRNISDSSELIFRSSFGVIDIFEPIVSNDQTVIIHNDEKTESSQVEVSAGLEHLQKGVEYYYNGQYREALKSYQLAAQFLNDLQLFMNAWDHCITNWVNIMTHCLNGSVHMRLNPMIT